MRAALPLLGGLMVLIGIVWFLQGINILPGSFMTGVAFWAIVGAAMIIGGIGLITVWFRGRHPAGTL